MSNQGFKDEVLIGIVLLILTPCFGALTTIDGPVFFAIKESKTFFSKVRAPVEWLQPDLDSLLNGNITQPEEKNLTLGNDSITLAMDDFYFNQTDWSKGPEQEKFRDGNDFIFSKGIDYELEQGSLRLYHTPYWVEIASMPDRRAEHGGVWDPINVK